MFGGEWTTAKLVYCLLTALLYDGNESPPSALPFQLGRWMRETRDRRGCPCCCGRNNDLKWVEGGEREQCVALLAISLFT